MSNFGPTDEIINQLSDRANGPNFHHFLAPSLVFVSWLFVDGDSVICVITEFHVPSCHFSAKSLANGRQAGATFSAIQCFCTLQLYF
jgi:hypothetical protein